ncbi:MAG: hypothetical protein AAGL49_14805, partial [Pseudomonadota bacterium]
AFLALDAMLYAVFAVSIHRYLIAGQSPQLMLFDMQVVWFGLLGLLLSGSEHAPNFLAAVVLQALPWAGGDYSGFLGVVSFISFVIAIWLFARSLLVFPCVAIGSGLLENVRRGWRMAAKHFWSILAVLAIQMAAGFAVIAILTGIAALVSAPLLSSHDVSISFAPFLIVMTAATFYVVAAFVSAASIIYLDVEKLESPSG